MLPDADGLALLDPAQLKSGWSETIERIANHYKFTDDQKSKAKALLEQGNAWADVWFNAYDNRRGAGEVPERAGRRSSRPSGIRTRCPMSASGPGRRGGRSRATARR